MPFVADLHLHSRYSRATSREADLEGYYRWARVKGISLLGTGDFTHPRWMSEISSRLIEKDGLLSFADEPKGSALSSASPAAIPVRFILTAEISSIYKKNGATRKVHSLIIVPSLHAARSLSRKLSAIGNIASDGRPILGLDPKDLLAMMLEVAPEGMLIPAHIWTPWFSIFGSKSGFDRIEDCFEELTPYIPALETGLSSDPPMNWRWSALDRFRLVSNSDAHSPANLGREANLFDSELSYEGVRTALVTGRGFSGTFEFHPEEGKYHADGHRKCGVCMDPEETLRRGEKCPECGKPMTIGVLNRVLSLADRAEAVQPRAAEGFRYLIPLPEILSELASAGVGSKGVTSLYERMIGAFGSEYGILFDVPLEDIEKGFGNLAAEAIRRMREGRVHPSPGYDGEFGRILLFERQELERLRGQDELFAVSATPGKKKARIGGASPLLGRDAAGERQRAAEPAGLDAEQEAAVAADSSAAIVQAGPGTGKTRLLTHWIARRIKEGAAQPGEALALTFTNRAAAEMRQRLRALLADDAEAILVTTFHSLCFSILHEMDPALQSIYGAADREEILGIILPADAAGRAREMSRSIEKYYEGVEPGNEELFPVVRIYEDYLAEIGAADLSSLVLKATAALRADDAALQRLRMRFTLIAVDELQDINPGQYELVMLLAGDRESAASKDRRRLLCIGDPDQAIYGFRGSDRGLFFRLRDELSAETRILTRSYRSTATILRAASSVLAGGRSESAPTLSAVRGGGAAIEVYAASDPSDEGRFIAHGIATLMGGVDSISADAARDASSGCSFADIAVLFRTRAIRDALLPALLRAGIPTTVRESSPLHSERPFVYLVAALRVLHNPRDAASLALLLQHVAPGRPIALAAAKALGAGDPPGELPAILAGLHGFSESSRMRLDSILTRRDELAALLESGGIPSVIDRILQQTVSFDGSDPRVVIGEQIIRETAGEFGSDLAAFLRQLSLLAVESEGAVRSEKVRLLTFHAAKGLEFPAVFLAGVEEGITPMPDNPEEERRLFYVAVTRAKDRLFISHCAHRDEYGEHRQMRPSRFLQDIPIDCRKDAERPAPRKDRSDAQLGLFE